MNDNPAKLYARLRVKTGSYEKDGKTKNRYAEVGVLFASPHFSNMYMQLETLPISRDWDGRIYIDPIEQLDTIQTKSDTHEFNKQVHKDVLPDDDEVTDKPNFDHIPF